MTAVTGGPVGQPQPAQLAPKSPTMATRLADAENRVTNFNDRICYLERVVGSLVTQNTEMREELGLQPLAPDHFS